MKISKLLTGLALVCSMGSAMALTSTVIGTGGTNSSYTFYDASTTPLAIGTLSVSKSGNNYLYSFSELASYLGDASFLSLTYVKSSVSTVFGINLGSGNDLIANASLTPLASGNQLSSATLTYSAAPTAPVPEPETYAMLLAGLGLMGAIARRRKSK